MPYILEKDKQILDPLIAKLREQILSLTVEWENRDAAENALWGYMFYTAKRVLKETPLNAAEQYQNRRGVRYWQIADQAGLVLNIVFELMDAVFSKFAIQGKRQPLYASVSEETQDIPPDSHFLNPAIDELILVIKQISGPEGYNFVGVYKGQVNYSMTELMPRVLMAFRKIDNGRIDTTDVESLMQFWMDVARDLYFEIARPYEDEQKAKNGDVKIYGEMLEWLN